MILPVGLDKAEHTQAQHNQQAVDELRQRKGRGRDKGSTIINIGMLHDTVYLCGAGVNLLSQSKIIRYCGIANTDITCIV